MYRTNTFSALLLVACIAFSCRSNVKKDQVIEFDSLNLSDKEIPLNPLDTVGEGLPIFYNMYLSVELSTLFESAGAVFSPELMNPVDKSSEYITSSQQAVNLGVYAVDLSYARVFDQVETAGKYFNTMKELSEDLGIPADYFENTVKRFERNFTNKDSLIILANEVYVTTEEYLRENERYTTAAIIILGGWIEAIHIAINVAVESKDANIIERLIEQKYSLNNLMLMLSEHSNDEIVAGYLTRLKVVKDKFDGINVVFDVDFNEKSDKGKEIINDALRQIVVLQTSVSSFRKELVN
jgi:hypothetical protein